MCQDLGVEQFHWIKRSMFHLYSFNMKTDTYTSVTPDVLQPNVTGVFEMNRPMENEVSCKSW